MRIAICEDDKIQRKEIRTSVEAYFRRQGCPVAIREFENALQLLMEYDEAKGWDILLLDIQMEGMDGVTLARQLRERDEALAIIFITGTTDYIFEGFSLHALNYLVKPFEEEKLFACLKKAQEQQERQGDFLLLRVEKELVRLRKDQILRVESDGHYLEVITKKQSCRVKMAMKELERELEGFPFFRLSRSDLVHLQAIERIQRKELRLVNGDCLPIPRGKYREVSEAFLDCNFRGEAQRW